MIARRLNVNETTTVVDGGINSMAAMTDPRLDVLIAKLRRVVEGFENEALNGVICTPPSGEYGGVGWTDNPNRRWCARCRSRWASLRSLPDEFSAALASLHEPAQTKEKK